MQRALFAFLALAAPAALAHADTQPLHVSIDGAADGVAIRDSITTELAAPVVSAEAAHCETPCLAISIDGTAASLTFMPVTGAWRSRMLDLGSDASQWPTLIALLAGNLVRDEADSLLADLPAAEPAAPAPVVAPAVVLDRPPIPRQAPPPLARPRRSAAVGFGVVPLASSDLDEIGTVEHTVSLHLLAGVSGGSRVAAIGGLSDLERGPVRGAQIAGAVVMAPQVHGFQIAGVIAMGKQVEGVQIAGGGVGADDVRGVQIGGMFAGAQRAAGLQIAGGGVYAGDLRGIQIAGGSSTATVSHGVQIAGLATYTERGANVQIAGATNIAASAHTQIAGGVNVAGKLTGFQLAPINIAREQAGVQLGVINVGGSPDGVSIGLINIVPGGRTDVEASVDSSALGTVLLRHGSRRWHNVYAVGGEQGNDVWMAGFGMGPSWTRGDATIDLDAMCWHVSEGSDFNEELSLLDQLRLSVAFDVGQASLVVGGALNVYVSTDQMNPLIAERRVPGAPMDSGVSVELWPSAFAGVRM
jgi:hypothetical protein